MKIDLLHEPDLEFAGGRHVDIRFGLKNFGPITVDDPTAPHEIRLAIVGTQSSIANFKEWLEQCHSGVSAKPSKKPNLFPAFPGFGKQTCFKCEWITSPRLEGAINQREIDGIISSEPPATGVEKLVLLFVDECKRLSERAPVDVFICVPPQELFAYTDKHLVSEEAEVDDDLSDSPQINVDFHDLLKAKGMLLPKPIQLVRPSTYETKAPEAQPGVPVRRLQDLATCAWNFHTALYYKAGGTLWRLPRSASDLASCYVGITFYKSRDRKTVHTSVAQVFNERGEGMILRGSDAEKSEEDRQPHLTRENMAALLKDVLNAFHREHKHWPARVVVHKTSSYNESERQGCDDTLNELHIASRDLLVVSTSYIRLFRNGQYPPLRGTFLNFDKRHSILYTRGSIDFYQMYPGMYVPRTLELKMIDTEHSPKVLAEEILALTKMNWNNTQFDAAYPITVKAARQVGSILRYLDRDAVIQSGYAFYM